MRSGMAHYGQYNIGASMSEHQPQTQAFWFQILSPSFGEKSEGKPGRISLVIWWHHCHSSTLQIPKTS